MKELLLNAKAASRDVARTGEDLRNKVLNDIADAICRESDSLLKANAEDLALMDKSNPLYDRLKLTEDRLRGIADGIKSVAALPSPLGCTLEERTLPNGMIIKKVSVPFGLIGVIYEARPNVTFDVMSLCFKSGNSCVLKGGRDAEKSNKEAIRLIHRVLSDNGLPESSVVLLPSTHQAASELLGAVGIVDLVIPRGGRRLIDFVRDNAKVPCIETGAGVVDLYFDKEADLGIGKAVLDNSKTRRVSVCNALDCLIVHKDRLCDLPELVKPLEASKVLIYADQRSFESLTGKYPFLEKAEESVYGTEFMDYKMSVKTVDSLDGAIMHIDRYGSGHSESIVTENSENARVFQKEVDAACVYVNLPTSFTDGGEFGLGAEIGISTQKLGARGPMGLKEITTYKWLIEGRGQVRR